MVYRRGVALLTATLVGTVLLPTPAVFAAPVASPSPSPASSESPTSSADPAASPTPTADPSTSPTPTATSGAEPAAAALAAASVAIAPDAIRSLTAEPGDRPGEVVFSWRSTGLNTSYFQLETAITSFSHTDPTMARRGRNPRSFTARATAKSITLSPDQTRQAGAGVGTGNHLYYLLVAVHRDANGRLTATPYPRVQAVLPRGRSAAKKNGTKVRAGTFNVRTARATTDKRQWLTRAPDVAREIVHHGLGAVALQELSPGRADGKKTPTKGTQRQTTSLLSALKKVGGSHYRLVRTTPYVKPGTKHGSQGTRILYDSRRFRLLSTCSERTGSKNYSSSCTIRLPLLSGDSEGLRRRAAYALLQDRQTKRKFYVVSAHLDQRHSSVMSTEIRYNQLRGQQAAAIVKGIARVNPKNRKVIFGGDVNSWQTNRAGHAPHSTLLANGFFDTASARYAYNLQYGTSNRFAPVLRPNIYGHGTRIDVVMVKGTSGANRFENVLVPVSSARPSDHNLVHADLVL